MATQHFFPWIATPAAAQLRPFSHYIGRYELLGDIISATVIKEVSSGNLFDVFKRWNRLVHLSPPLNFVICRMNAPSTQPSLSAITFKAGYGAVNLQHFLLGVYSMIYCGTLYMYLTSASFKHRVVISAMTLSYLICLANVVVGWYFFGITPIDIRGMGVAILDTSHPRWETLLEQGLFFSVAIMADLLLIWRCYNAWNCSIRHILLPVSLVLCEAATFMAMVVIACIDKFRPSPTQSILLNYLIGTIYLTSAGTILVTTLLISYRIHAFSKGDLSNGSLSRFKHVVDILVQSAGAYFAAAIAFAIASIIPNETSAIVENARSYTAILYFFTAGTAPTVMVARVIYSTNSSTAPGLPDLSVVKFRRTHQLATDTAQCQLSSIPPEDQDSCSLHEVSQLDTKTRRVLGSRR